MSRLQRTSRRLTAEDAQAPQHRPEPPSKPSESVATLRDRDMWLVALAASRSLGDGDKVLGVRLALHHNVKTGQCNPSYDALAHGTGRTVSAIPKQLKRLEETGFINRISSKGRYRNSYELTLPAEATTDGWIGSTPDHEIGSTLDRGTLFDPVNPAPADRRTPARRTGQPYPAIETNREENNEKNREGERYISDQFDEFWKQYPKRVDKGSARKAFAKALAKATIEQVMAGVYRYAAERTNQDPKFTKHAATWLNHECWLDEPQPQHRPQRAPVDSGHGINWLVFGSDGGRFAVPATSGPIDPGGFASQLPKGNPTAIGRTRTSRARGVKTQKITWSKIRDQKASSGESEKEGQARPADAARGQQKGIAGSRPLGG
ncbi:hypothetical protein ACVWZ6_005591 [Bradyrhizobium sp. GM6.1]